MTAIFITATGTDVGKTFVAASLIGHFRQMGRLVEAIKPVVSGFDPAQAATSDPGVLLKALGLPVTAPQIERISPWRFRAALSPDLAARREGRSIDVDDVIAFCQSAIERRQDMLLIEGVGGVMVPLAGRQTVRDLIAAIGCPALLVAGSYLGTLSHTLTAVEALAGRGIALAGIVVSESAESPVPLVETVATVTRLVAPVPVVGLPRLETGTTAPDLAGFLGI